METWGEKTSLTVPLIAGGEAMGIMVLTVSDRERRFTEPELELARTLGEQAAVAIRNALDYERRRREAQRTSALLVATIAINSTPDAGEVAVRGAQAAGQLLGSDRCDLYWSDQDPAAMTLGAAWKPSPAPSRTASGETPSMDHTPTDRRPLERGEVVLERLGDVALDPHTQAEMEHRGEKVRLTVPLVARGEPLGILVFGFEEGEQTAADEELEFAHGVGELVGVALDNARRTARLEAKNAGKATPPGS